MKTMTPKSYQSYMRFIELHEQPLIWTRKMLANAIWKLREVNERARKKIYAIIFYRTRIRVLIPIVFPETVRVSRDALLLHWSTHLLQERYSKANSPKA